MPGLVLIVDDEPDVVEYLKVVLEVAGFETLVAMSAGEAFELARRHRPALICLDILMPEETGFSLYRRLRQHEELRSVPVVIISGVAREQEFDFRAFVPETHIPEPDRYLEKPIAVDQFLAVVDEMMQRPSPRATARS